MHHDSTPNERLGTILVIISAATYALFPVLLNHELAPLPPLLFAAMLNLLSALVVLPIVIARGEIPRLQLRALWKDYLGLVFGIIILPQSLIFYGAQKTSAINTTFFLQFEVLYTLLISRYLFGARLTKFHAVGGTLIFLSGVFAAYKPGFQLNSGDLFVAAGAFFYPFGNHFSKRIVAAVPSFGAMLIRFSLGGLGILALSMLLESPSWTNLSTLEIKGWVTILSGVLIVFVVSKFAWYEGLRHLSIVQAVNLAFTCPAISVVLAMSVLGELPNIYQLTGFVLLFPGLWFTTRSAPTTAVVSPGTDVAARQRPVDND